MNYSRYKLLFILLAVFIPSYLLLAPEQGFLDQTYLNLKTASRFPFIYDARSKKVFFKSKEADTFIIERQSLDDSKKSEVIYNGEMNPLSMHLSSDSKFLTMQGRQKGGYGYSSYILDLQSKEACRLPLAVLKNALAPLRWSPSSNELAFYNERFEQGGLGIISGGKCDGTIKPFISRISLDSDFVWSASGKSLYLARQGEIPFIEEIDTDGKQISKIELVAGLRGKLGQLSVSPDKKFLTAEFIRKGKSRWGAIECLLATKECRELNLPEASFSHQYLENGQMLSHFRPFPFSVDIKTSEKTQSSLNDIGITQLIGLSEDKIYLRQQPLCTFGKVVVQSLETKKFPDKADNCTTPEIIPDSYKDFDPTAAPLTIFSTKEKTGKVLVVVDAHPYSFSAPVWGSLVNDFISKGISIVAVDYLGDEDWQWSSDFEAVFDIRLKRVQRAIAYARNGLGGKPESTVVYGASYAGKLALEASSGMNLGGAVIVGAKFESDAHDKNGFPKSITIYQSEFDEWNNAGENLNNLKKYFKTSATNTSSFRTEILKGESHTPVKLESWVKIFTEVESKFK